MNARGDVELLVEVSKEIEVNGVVVLEEHDGDSSWKF